MKLIFITWHDLSALYKVLSHFIRVNILVMTIHCECDRNHYLMTIETFRFISFHFLFENYSKSLKCFVFISRMLHSFLMIDSISKTIVRLIYCSFQFDFCLHDHGLTNVFWKVSPCHHTTVKWHWDCVCCQWIVMLHWVWLFSLLKSVTDFHNCSHQWKDVKESVENTNLPAKIWLSWSWFGFA